MPRSVTPFVTLGEASRAVTARLDHQDKDTSMTETPKPRARRGFAAMSPERRREIARKGGASVDPANRSFSKDRGLAASAGRLGGEASRGGGRQKHRSLAAE